VVKNPVTAEHAGKFAAYVTSWQDQLSLGDWRIAVSEVRSNRKVMAECYKFDLEQRSVTIRLGKDFSNTVVTDEELNKLALHECLHVFFHELIVTADKPEAASLEHRCINVLERLLADKP
jgi:hypothetical protein